MGTWSRLQRLWSFHPAWLALVAALGLTLIGTAAISTVDLAAGTGSLASQQLQRLLVALAAMALCILPHPRRLALWAYSLMGLSLLLLTVLILPGVPETLVPVRNATRAWLNLGLIAFQPSELAKIAAVLALARYLRHRDNHRTLRGLLAPFLIMFLPLLLILREPDLGTALLFPVVLFAMLTAAGARLRHIGSLLALALLALAINLAIIWFLPDSMQILKPYQVNRVRAMIDLARGGDRYLTSEGYQQSKAITLAGAGGLWGLGKERAATLLKFNHLPEAHNDMIFPVVVLRWGLIGGLTVTGLYTILILAFLRIAWRNKDPFARLVMVGLSAFIFAQTAINIAMSLGLLPVIGITLPFLSYGGSSLLAGYMSIGLAFNFASQAPAIITLPSFEFDTAELATH